jgi:hypothetical protein
VIAALGGRNRGKTKKINPKPMVTTDDSSNTNSYSLLNKKISPRGQKKNAYIKDELQVGKHFDRMLYHKRAVSLARNDNLRGASTLQVSTGEDQNSGAFWDNMLEQGKPNYLNSPRVGVVLN